MYTVWVYITCEIFGSREFMFLYDETSVLLQFYHIVVLSFNLIFGNGMKIKPCANEF